MAVDLRHANSKAKIGDDQLSLAVNKQVLWLDISMHNAVRVQVARTFYQLVQNVASHAFAEGRLGVLKEAVELTKLGQLHHVINQVRLALFDSEWLFFFAIALILHWLKDLVETALRLSKGHVLNLALTILVKYLFDLFGFRSFGRTDVLDRRTLELSVIKVSVHMLDQCILSTQHRALLHGAFKARIQYLHDVRVPAFGQDVDLLKQTVEAVLLVHHILDTHELDGDSRVCRQLNSQFHSANNKRVSQSFELKSQCDEMKLAEDGEKNLLCVATLTDSLQYLVLIVQHLLRDLFHRARFFIIIEFITLSQAFLNASVTRECQLFVSLIDLFSALLLLRMLARLLIALSQVIRFFALRLFIRHKVAR